MAEIELSIVGRNYSVRCRDGEEESLRAAGRLVDSKCREALSGLGTLTESRQFFYAALLLADQIMERQVGGGTNSAVATPASQSVDPQLLVRAENLATWLESLADSLETGAPLP